MWPVLIIGAGLVALVAWIVAGTFSSGPTVHLYAAAIPGYAVDPASTGTLSINAAAQATIMPSDTVLPELRRDGFTSGQARTWRHDDDFAEIVAYRLADSKHARAFVRFAIDYAMQLPGGGVHAGKAALYSVPGVPTAQGFMADGNSTVGSQPLFVQGAWYVDGPIAYLIETGGPQPAGVDFAVTLTQRQHALTR